MKLVRTVLGAAVAVAAVAVLQVSTEATASAAPVNTTVCFSCWEIVQQ